MGEDFDGEEDLAGGFILDCCRRGNQAGSRRGIFSGFLFMRAYWYLQRLGHLHVPVALGVECHGGEGGM